MAVKVGINGFGRIGRIAFRAMLKHHQGEVDIVAVNDLSDTATNAFLLKHDSTYGDFDGRVEVKESNLVVNGNPVRVFAEKEPSAVPWGSVGVEVVIESTGFFTDATKAVAHKRDSVRKVIISAPARNEDITIVLGVNEQMYDRAKHHVISNASCTTNGLAPVAKVLHERFGGIDRGLLTTVHAYTNSQRLQDMVSKDLRDARAAAENIVPSATGAARAVGLVIPDLKGRFTGMAFRVPTPTVSVIDFTALLNKEATVEDINAAMKEYAEGAMKGILAYTEEPLVSSDLKGNDHSSIFSALDTLAMGNFVKVVSWYDNEWGYSCRLGDLVAYVAKKGL
jgi:glyceraldehyde 3-phosphate dehydrogenase